MQQQPQSRAADLVPVMIVDVSRRADLRGEVMCSSAQIEKAGYKSETWLRSVV